MTKFTRVFPRFECYAEDLACEYCKYYKERRGCTRNVCCCEAELSDAVENGRIKRKRGWAK